MSNTTAIRPAVIALSRAEIEAFIAGGSEAALRELLPDATWINPDETEAARWADLEPEMVVAAWRTNPLTAGLRRLKYVCSLVGSVRSLVPRTLLEGGVRVTNWGPIAAPMVAEQALLLMLGSLRSLPRWQGFMSAPASHEDSAKLETRSLHGRRVALHGFGQIARELLKLLKPFEASVSAYSVGVPAAFIREYSAEPVATLEALADGAEIFVTCEALTETTRGTITRSVLERLAPGAVFVNAGRGAVVDEAALAEVAGRRGLRIGLDVYSREPLPLDSPLRPLPDALLSPHIGGPTRDAYPRCGEAAIDNVQRYLTGRPLLNEVTLEMYDRST